MKNLAVSCGQSLILLLLGGILTFTFTLVTLRGHLPGRLVHEAAVHWLWPLDLYGSNYAYTPYSTIIKKDNSSLEQSSPNQHPCHPQGLHIAQADSVGDDGLVSFTVTLHVDFDACPHAVPAVVYGQHWWQRGTAVHGISPLQFNYTQKADAHVFTSPWIWHITLPNLRAGPKMYWYKVVVYDGSQKHYHRYPVAASTFLYFRTPPRRGAPTTMALLGDLGQTTDSARTIAHMRKAVDWAHAPVTQLLLAGDLSYADGDPNRWTSWFDLVEPLSSRLALHVAAGNHEIERDHASDLPFVPYEHYFRVPNRLADADVQPSPWDWGWKTHWYNFGNAFYTYEHGLAQIIVLSSFSDTSVDSVQYDWLVDVLDNGVDRTATPWLIVAFHAPWYTTFRGHVNESAAQIMRKAMEPLFQQYGVNLVVSGHDHAYMRTYPLYQGNVIDDNSDNNVTAPIYLTVGAGGNREHHAPGYRNATIAEPWVAARQRSEYGYGHLQLVNATHALFQWIGNGAPLDDADDDSSDTVTKIWPRLRVHDRVWFTNPHVVTTQK